MAAALLESAAAIRPPPAVGPCPAVKAAAFAAPAPKMRHIPSRFAGLRAVTLPSRACLMGAGTTGSFRRGVVCEARNTAVNDVTKDTWQALVLESDLPVLVEFWAPWCGPCRMIHPVIGELSKEYSGKLKCFQLNTDQSPDIATQYGIRSIPTVMLFKGGEKKDAVIGAVPKSTLISSIDKFLHSTRSHDQKKMELTKAEASNDRLHQNACWKLNEIN